MRICAVISQQRVHDSCLLPSLRCLRVPNSQLNHVVNDLKFRLAVPGAQILSEGMTQAEVHAAMDQLRLSNAAGGDAAAVGSNATPLMQVAARRLSQEAALSSGADAAAAGARRLLQDAAANAVVLHEASHHSQAAAAELTAAAVEEEAREPFDVSAAVSLAEACAQAVWGSAHYCLDEPLHVTQVSMCCTPLHCLASYHLCPRQCRPCAAWRFHYTRTPAKTSVKDRRAWAEHCIICLWLCDAGACCVAEQDEPGLHHHW
jgi:hypothetical protein